MTSYELRGERINGLAVYTCSFTVYARTIVRHMETNRPDPAGHPVGSLTSRLRLCLLISLE
jgi:hypothetical protein